jgi:hypothetical protein
MYARVFTHVLVRDNRGGSEEGNRGFDAWWTCQGVTCVYVGMGEWECHSSNWYTHLEDGER